MNILSCLTHLLFSFFTSGQTNCCCSLSYEICGNDGYAYTIYNILSIKNVTTPRYISFVSNCLTHSTALSFREHTVRITVYGTVLSQVSESYRFSTLINIKNLPANLSFTAWCANAAGWRGGRLHDNGALCGGTRNTCPAEYKG